MNKKLLTLTYVMFGVSIIFALLMVACLFISIFVAKVAPPIIICSILNCPAILFVLHYRNCIKAIKNMQDFTIKQLNRMQTINTLILIFSFGPIAMYTPVLLVWLPINFGNAIFGDSTMLTIYIVATCMFIISTLFNINLSLLNRLFNNCVKKREQDHITNMKFIATLQHYKFEAKPELADIIDDSVTFAVLKKILRFNCTDIFTNHQTFVICYSNAPYPVWIWCKRPYDEKDAKLIADILKVEFLDKGDYRLIISEDLLQELSKTHHVFAKMHQKMQLFSYELRQINAIDHKCDGRMRRPKTTEIDTLAMHYHNASMEMEGHDFSMEDCKKIITGYMQNDELFVWVDDNDQITATANKILDGNYAKIAFVYTLPTHRRKGYAINLVHKVSQMLLDDGLIPILYTNGGYVASNECYKKIGYVQVGKLVDVCVDKTDKLD